MIKNRRTKVSRIKIKKLKKKYQEQENVFLLELDGNDIKVYHEYISAMNWQVRITPTFWNNLNSYADMMTDKNTYYNKAEVVVLISNHRLFLSDDIEKKEIIEEIFDEIILPFFEEEIVRCVVGGERMKYNIYYSM